jgi:hypothetical protein
VGWVDVSAVIRAMCTVYSVYMCDSGHMSKCLARAYGARGIS